MTNKQKKRKERNDKILLLYKQNKPIHYIVQVCNVSRETVYRIMRDVKRPSKSQLKVMKTIEEPIEQVLQCTQCDSEGELVIKKETETYDQE